MIGDLTEHVESFTLSQWLVNNGLTTLIFRNDFNQPIAPGVLPNRLTSLTFGYYFDQPIAHGVLPNGLTSLKFGDHFNHPIAPGILPDGLTSLTFGERFNQPIAPGVLPDGLTSLTFGLLPSGLTSLTFGYDFNRPIAHGSLPDGLTSLTFGYHFNQSIALGALTDAPSLILDRFNQPIAPGVLPNELSSLDFESIFNKPMAHGVLPNGLTSLTFGSCFDQPIAHGVLPNGLTSLTFGDYFNRRIAPRVLPNGLTSLIFGSGFEKSIEPGVLPMGLGIKILMFSLFEVCQSDGMGWSKSLIFSLKLFGHDIAIKKIALRLSHPTHRVFVAWLFALLVGSSDAALVSSEIAALNDINTVYKRGWSLTSDPCTSGITEFTCNSAGTNIENIQLNMAYDVTVNTNLPASFNNFVQLKTLSLPASVYIIPPGFWDLSTTRPQLETITVPTYQSTLPNSWLAAGGINEINIYRYGPASFTFDQYSSFQTIYTITIGLYFQDAITTKTAFPSTLLNNNKIYQLNIEGDAYLGLTKYDFTNTPLTKVSVRDAPTFGSQLVYPGIVGPAIDYLLLSNCGIQSLSLINIDQGARTLYLNDNKMAGTIPSTSNTLFNALGLNNNKLTGSLPEWTCTASFVDVSNNLLTGAVPDCFICEADDSQIKSRLSGNQFNNFGPNTAYSCPSFKTTGYSSVLFPTLGGKMNITTTNFGWTITNQPGQPYPSVIIPNSVWQIQVPSMQAGVVGSAVSYSYKFHKSRITETITFGYIPPTITGFKIAGNGQFVLLGTNLNSIKTNAKITFAGFPGTVTAADHVSVTANNPFLSNDVCAVVVIDIAGQTATHTFYNLSANPIVNKPYPFIDQTIENTLEFTGNHFGIDISLISLQISNLTCVINEMNNTYVKCILPASVNHTLSLNKAALHPVGNNVTMTITNAFTYQASITVF
eukprot:gene5973-6918_t